MSSRPERLARCGPAPTTAASSWASVRRPSSISSEPSGVPSDNLHRLPSARTQEISALSVVGCIRISLSVRTRNPRNRPTVGRDPCATSSESLQPGGRRNVGGAVRSAVAKAGEGAEVAALFGGVDLALVVVADVARRSGRGGATRRRGRTAPRARPRSSATRLRLPLVRAGDRRGRRRTDVDRARVDQRQDGVADVEHGAVRLADEVAHAAAAVERDDQLPALAVDA